MNSRRWNVVRLVAWAVTAVFLSVFPVFVDSPYYLHVAIVIGLNLMVVLSVMIILLMGQLSIGQAAFMGVGAYSSALMVSKLGVSFWIALPLAGLIAALLGMFLGFLTLRTKGIYFAVLTFAFGEFVRLVFVNWRSVFGGATGLIGVPAPDAIVLFGTQLEFGSKVAYYYLVAAVVLLVIVLVRQIIASPFGRTLRAIAQDEPLAESLGINTVAYRVAAFVLACFVAGIGGALHAHYYHYVGPVSFGFASSVHAVVLAVVGGTSSVAGPVLSTVCLTAFSEVLRSIREYELFIYGAVVIAVLFAMPRGIAGGLEGLSRYLADRRGWAVASRLVRFIPDRGERENANP